MTEEIKTQVLESEQQTVETPTPIVKNNAPKLETKEIAFSDILEARLKGQDEETTKAIKEKYSNMELSTISNKKVKEAEDKIINDIIDYKASTKANATLTQKETELAQKHQEEFNNLLQKYGHTMESGWENEVAKYTGFTAEDIEAGKKNMLIAKNMLEATNFAKSKQAPLPKSMPIETTQEIKDLEAKLTQITKEVFLYKNGDPQQHLQSKKEMINIKTRIAELKNNNKN